MSPSTTFQHCACTVLAFPNMNMKEHTWLLSDSSAFIKNDHLVNSCLFFFFKLLSVLNFSNKQRRSSSFLSPPQHTGARMCLTKSIFV